jgi:hypothetical protein
MDSTKNDNTIDTINTIDITSITGAQGSNASIGNGGTWNVTAGPYISSVDTSNLMWTTTPNTVWTTNTSDWSIGTSVGQSGTMELKGDNADIVVNGESLMQTLQVLKDRLNWLQPNPDMESEWDELRELGERYRELEKRCQEKSQVWNTLKKMPDPLGKK